MAATNPTNSKGGSSDTSGTPRYPQNISGRPFASDSFWNTPLPSDAPLSTNSAEYVTSLVTQISTYYGHAAINTSKYTPPVWTVPANQPLVNVAAWNCQNKKWMDPSFQAQISEIPIPTYAIPSPGTDSEMVVWQPSTDTEWDLWKARDLGGQWEACWGGRLPRASQSEGIFPSPFGATATGLAYRGGLIDPSELISGQIDHALAISLVLTKKSELSWPADRTDGSYAGPGAVPEGTRFRLSPSIDIASLNLNPVAKAIALAAQKYGFVVRDHAGSVALYAVNSLTYTQLGQENPYPKIFGGLQNWQVLDGFPWKDLQALAPGYGKPG